MDSFVLAVFLLVYLGMILGELPGLAVDRTGVALQRACQRLARKWAWPTVPRGCDVSSQQLRLEKDGR